MAIATNRSKELNELHKKFIKEMEEELKEHLKELKSGEVVAEAVFAHTRDLGCGP